MDIIKNFKNSTNGIYPILPGMTIELGDFGYWEKNSWMRLGNIKENFHPIYFSESTREVNQDLEVIIGASLSGEGAINLNAIENGVSTNISFKSHGAIYYNASLCEENFFPSIKGEIEPFIQKLSNKKQWDDKWWIAVSIYKARKLICIQSNEKSSTITLQTKISENTPVSEAVQGKAVFNITGESNNITKIIGNGETENVAGIKFIGYSKEHFYSKNRNIHYQGESNGEINFNSMTEELSFY